MKKTGKINCAFAAAYCLSFLSFSQVPITAEEAVNMGLNNHPIWVQAEGALLMAQAEKSASVTLDPIELEVQYGQMNTLDIDYNIAVQQNIGSILTHLRRGQSGRALIELRQAELDQTEERLTWVIRQAYYDWHWSYANWKLLDGHLDSLDVFVSMITTRVEDGEARQSEAIQAEAELLRFRNRVRVAHSDFLTYNNALKTLLQSDANMIPASPQYSALMTTQGVRVLDSTLLMPLVAQQSYSEAKIAEEQAVFFPSFSIGYFNQSLENVPGFTGWTFGMQYPLWFARERANIQQAKVQADIDVQNANYTLQQNQKALAYVKKRMAIQLEQINLFAEPAAQNAHDLIKAGREEWTAGEIDFYQFFLIIGTSVNLELDRLAVIHRYNTSVLHYEYLSQ